MMRRLSGKLEPSGVVLGSPHSGAAHLYGLIGQPVAAITPPRTRLTVRGRREVRSRPLVASHAPPLSIATAARGSSRATIAGAMRLLSPNQGRSSSARSGRDERPATNRTSMVARAARSGRPPRSLRTDQAPAAAARTKAIPPPPVEEPI